MAFLWLHCAFENDRVIYLNSIKEAYDAGVIFALSKTHKARIEKFEEIENSMYTHSFVPIAECIDFQLIIGKGQLTKTTLLFFNGNVNVHVVDVVDVVDVVEQPI